MDFQKLRQKDVAKAFAVSARTVQNWTDAGLPRNGDGSYSLPDCIAWRTRAQVAEAGELDPVAERARRDSEAADKLALENAQTRGEVARLSVIERELSALFSDLRTNALALPSKVAPQLAGLEPVQMARILEDAVRALLTELAEYQPGHATN